MNNYLTIFINGDPFNCDSSMSLKDILLYLNFNINSIIIEYNQDIINLSSFDSISLKNNDHLEVITIVGGG
uniref:Thiamin biosynthesis protein S n=1 Tax=Acrosorium ciliolatum TaxID=1550622 RepID=A0A1Z1M1Y4_9FLOR|nr:thiamin biosynthesis protein S [Acrosorium ciliolatum]ARW60088.1 thiamin biosynthesis protein S [Acrosorium ciliolatum]